MILNSYLIFVFNVIAVYIFVFFLVLNLFLYKHVWFGLDFDRICFYLLFDPFHCFKVLLFL